MNLGIFGDTIQNLHWRIKRSALAEVRPKLIVQLIGINNYGKYSVDEIIAGNAALVKTLHEMTPETKILLMGLFPKGRTNQDLKTTTRV